MPSRTRWLKQPVSRTDILIIWIATMCYTTGLTAILAINAKDHLKKFSDFIDQLEPILQLLR